jgi:hypothetical protein
VLSHKLKQWWGGGQALFFSNAGQAPSDGAWGPGGRQEGSIDTARSLASAVASGYSLLVNGGGLVLQEYAPLLPCFQTRLSFSS